MTTDLSKKVQDAVKHALDWPLNSSVCTLFKGNEKEELANFIFEVRQLFAPAYESPQFVVSESELGDGNFYLYNLTASATRRTKANEALLAGIKAKAAEKNWSFTADAKKLLEEMEPREKVKVQMVIDHTYSFYLCRPKLVQTNTEIILSELEQLRSVLRVILPKDWLYCLGINQCGLGLDFCLSLAVPPEFAGNSLVQAIRERIEEIADDATKRIATLKR